MTFSGRLAIAAEFVFVVLGACQDGAGPAAISSDESRFVVLSDTSLGFGAAVEDVAIALETQVIYVSLQAGSIPSGVSGVIRNLRTRTTASASIVGGGFDPLLISGRTNDTMQTIVSLNGGGESILVSIVPARRPPCVARTIPPRGKK